MNPAQKAALRALQAAFARCAEARLRFCGMDHELIAYEGVEFDRLREGLLAADSAYEIQRQMDADGNGGENVNTHGCYVDSGGW